MTGAWCRACRLRARVRARVGYQLARGCLELGLAIRLHDLDLLYQTAGLAASEHAAELVGVKVPRQDHLVLLILHFVEDEFSSGCTRDVSRTGPISYARENLGCQYYVAAVQVKRDDYGGQH